MKISYQKISAIAIVALFLFSSCSRELTSSIPQTNKLANVQMLPSTSTVARVSTGPTTGVSTSSGTVAMVKAPSPKPAMENNVSTLPSTGNDMKQMTHTGKMGHSLMANMLPKKAVKQILKQANTIRNLGSNNEVTSYSKTSHTESWLGLALTCLIVGIILLALGFGTLGAIFWEIGVVILVIAIVFFILWLLAAAAGE